jgi:hypothetical protein
MRDSEIIETSSASRRVAALELSPVFQGRELVVSNRPEDRALYMFFEKQIP